MTNTFSPQTDNAYQYYSSSNICVFNLYVSPEDYKGIVDSVQNGSFPVNTQATSSIDLNNAVVEPIIKEPETVNHIEDVTDKVPDKKKVGRPHKEESASSTSKKKSYKKGRDPDLRDIHPMGSTFEREKPYTGKYYQLNNPSVPGQKMLFRGIKELAIGLGCSKYEAAKYKNGELIDFGKHMGDRVKTLEGDEKPISVKYDIEVRYNKYQQDVDGKVYEVEPKTGETLRYIGKYDKVHNTR